MRRGSHSIGLMLIAFFIVDPAKALSQEQLVLPRRVAKAIQTQVLIAPTAGGAKQVGTYPAFPAILDLGSEILVSYKHGRSHARDVGATLDLLRIDAESGISSSPRVIAQLPDRIMQMGEWVRFPNGDIANYIDVQTGASGRAGLHGIRSTDGGKTFSGAQPVGLIDGVEYGYAFDAVVKGATTWMLAMTFSNLPGGQTIFPARPHAGAVAIVRSVDNGLSWRFVRDLTREIGNRPINESCLIAHGNEFLISTRGYDQRQRLHRLDASFALIDQVDLTEKYACIESHLGRPRLFSRDGQIYLMGRNTSRRDQPMELSLFEIEPTTLAVTGWTILDNDAAEAVYDGYYAMAYFRGTGVDERMHVITYRGLPSLPGPEIIRLEFRWDEIR